MKRYLIVSRVYGLWVYRPVDGWGRGESCTDLVAVGYQSRTEARRVLKRGQRRASLPYYSPVLADRWREAAVMTSEEFLALQKKR